MKDRITVFSPHEDDETLACGGTIAKKIEEGYDVYIVFMTDGRNSHVHEQGISSNPTPQELALIRREEAKKAIKILGVTEGPVFLDFEDGSLENCIVSAKEKVTKILDELRPIEVYCPHISDKHKDHCVTNRIVITSIATLFLTPKIYQYVVWSSGFEKLEEGEKRVVVDITNFRQRKLRAIEEYKSQVTLFSQEQQQPILSAEFIKNVLSCNEVFLEANIL
jgi:LmbE family N-acetylglucosaminyl deacetylase